MTKQITKAIKEEKNPKEQPLNEEILLKNLDEFRLPRGVMHCDFKELSLSEVNLLMGNGSWIVPKDFQRDEIYTDAQKIGLLETLFKKEEIPELTLYQPDRNDEVYYIVDGQQRSSALRDGLGGKLVFKFYDENLKDLNGYTFDKLPSHVQEEIKIIKIRVRILSGMDMESVQRYYTLLNSTSVPLSPGELFFAIPNPAHKFFLNAYDMGLLKKVWNYQRKPKWLLIARLFYLFVEGDLKHHKYIGNPKTTMLRYFNSVEEHTMTDLWNKVRHLLNSVENYVGECGLPHGINQMFNWICAIGTLNENERIDTELLQKVISWTLAMMKNPYQSPIRYRKLIDSLIETQNGASEQKINEFVTTFEKLYCEGEKLWDKSQ